MFMNIPSRNNVIGLLFTIYLIYLWIDKNNMRPYPKF